MLFLGYSASACEILICAFSLKTSVLREKAVEYVDIRSSYIWQNSYAVMWVNAHLFVFATKGTFILHDVCLSVRASVLNNGSELADVHLSRDAFFSPSFNLSECAAGTNCSDDEKHNYDLLWKLQTLPPCSVIKCEHGRLCIVQNKIKKINASGHKQRL